MSTRQGAPVKDHEPIDSSRRGQNRAALVGSGEQPGLRCPPISPIGGDCLQYPNRLYGFDAHTQPLQMRAPGYLRLRDS
jgi:hypothetical protein